MKQQLPYQFLRTEDGSPTLRFFGHRSEESMHSHAGAFSETLYIYGEAILKKINEEKVNILSVGLGLAYNEILAVSCAIKNNNTEALFIESYEKDGFLIQQFENWILNENSAFTPVYNDITERFAGHYKIDSSLIKEKLEELYLNKKINLKKSISFTTKFQYKFDIILFDAFCSRTSPDLWQPGFLEYLIDSGTKKSCVFATYACKTTLNNILNDFDFELLPKKALLINDNPL